MSDILKLSKVSKSFGPAQIIKNLDLNIKKGERHAIIGPNGAGKSTLFHLISGHYTPTSGSIVLNNEEIGSLDPHDINRKGLARSFQVTNIFPKMTVAENIRCGMLWAKDYKYSIFKLVNNENELNKSTSEILEELNLNHCANIPAGLLSYADQRALEIGITIASGADTIMLDEPTAGMSNSETERAVELIKKISEKRTLLIVEHDMGVVFDLADRISVLVYGEIICTDTPKKVRTNKKVQEAYLGTEEH
ncbi:MAG: ABC transporter ATP-binding protein [Alphaproteobacteria bacterium]|jgi:branched-chain amino acid transport system ATP-binding protein|nr:ABC transporter ATP-binding protein [Alphaproteobacteria bacterium]|tara:strand:- start:389 stop:1138 length:750 start_codon:yes stop_codon:yes gene_type:complete